MIRDHQYFSTIYKETGLKKKDWIERRQKEGRRQATVELLQEMGMEKENACVQRCRKSFSFLSKRLSRKWKNIGNNRGRFLVFKTGMVKNVKTGYLRKANLNVVFI